jgi:hypothetical protein
MGCYQMSKIWEIYSGFQNYLWTDWKLQNNYDVTSSANFNDSKGLLLASCFLGLYFDVESGGGIFLRNIDNFYQTTRRYIPKYIILQQ